MLPACSRHLVGVVGELDAARLAPPADVHLGLDDHRVADRVGGGDGLVDGVDRRARRRPGCRTWRRTACLGIRGDPRRKPSQVADRRRTVGTTRQERPSPRRRGSADGGGRSSRYRSCVELEGTTDVVLLPAVQRRCPASCDGTDGLGGGRRLADLHEVDHEDQRLVGPDLRAAALLAVGEVRRDDELASPADFMPSMPWSQPGMTSAGAERERDGSASRLHDESNSVPSL